MKRVIERFWMVCLVPLAVPFYYLPLQVQVGLVLLAAILWSKRVTD